MEIPAKTLEKLTRHHEERKLTPEQKDILFDFLKMAVLDELANGDEELAEMFYDITTQYAHQKYKIETLKDFTDYFMATLHDYLYESHYH